MGKTRALYKKIREIKGKFQAKIGMIQDRNRKDLGEAEDVKESWAEYVEDLYKREPHNDRSPTGDVNVNLELEPDILESEIQWALENMADNTISGHDEIPAELFKVTGKDTVKVLHSICQKIWITQQWPKDWKRSVFIPIPKKRSSKECSDYQTIALISHASKVTSKILQNRLCQYLDRELPEEQAGFRKRRGTRDQIANIRWIMEKAREFQRDVYLCFIDYAKAFDCVDHNKLW
ncbi:uncharacterized protein LOC124788994, partial [Schistocerca piceifrons]|uniref:uncharacterized protein LOC124788994 n=1 Tax=Schistocerca piceifrons TaxID=274613 RepID=UPI001F5ED0BF